MSPLFAAVAPLERWATGCPQRHSSSRRRRVQLLPGPVPIAVPLSGDLSALPAAPRGVSPAGRSAFPDGSALRLLGWLANVQGHGHTSSPLFSGVAETSRHGWRWSRATPQ